MEHGSVCCDLGGDITVGCWQHTQERDDGQEDYRFLSQDWKTYVHVPNRPSSPWGGRKQWD